MDSSKINLKKERAALKLKMLINFKDVPLVEIPLIPLERTLFPGTKNDYWKAVDVESLTKSSCIYELDANCFFPTHIHPESNEKCILLTEGAEVEFITEEGIFEYKYPSEFLALKGIKHALINKSNFPIKIRVEWEPKMIGWVATYSK